MLRIIFQDDDLLVLDKPAGLVVDKSNTQQKETLEDILQKEFRIKLERGGIAHRLDKDTSGILLVAKTQEALENLQAQFKDRKTKKEYVALVHGLVESSGKVEGNIGRNPGNREKFTVVMSTSKESKPTFEVSVAREAVTEYVFDRPARSQAQDLVGQLGKEATTEYEPIERLQFTGNRLQEIFHEFNKIQFRKLSTIHYNLFTLLKCYPLTGRTHQIRVHLKYINHPIVSDKTYVGRKMYRLDHRWCPRQFLHAKKIGFYHPGSGEWMEMEAHLAEDLNKSLKLLKS